MLEDDRPTEIFVERHRHRGSGGQRLQGAGQPGAARHAGGVRRHRPRARRLPLRDRRRPRRSAALEEGERRAPRTSGPPAARDAVDRRPAAGGAGILVQVIKEPLLNKGARVTTHVTLPGRYLVLLPTVRHLGVSRRIEDEEERARLRGLLRRAHRRPRRPHRAHRRRGQAARGVRGRSRLPGRSLGAASQRRAERCAARRPSCTRSSTSRCAWCATSFSADFAVLWVDGEETYERIVEFLDQVQPALPARVRLVPPGRVALRALRHRARRSRRRSRARSG